MLRLKKRGDIWYVRGTVAGERIYESAGTPDEEEAKAYLAKRQGDVYAVRRLGAKQRHLFGSVVHLYLESRDDDLGHASRRYLLRLMDRFENISVSDIGQQDLDRYIRDAYPHAVGSTINRSVIIPMTTILRFAAKRVWCDVPLFQRRKEKERKPRFLSYGEIRSLLGVCRENFRSLLSFMLNTGCRVGEALTLQWYAVDLEQRIVTFGKTDRDKTKNDETRVVPLNRMAFADLVFTPHRVGHVFLNRSGEPYMYREDGGGAISKPFATALKAACVAPCRVHDLRHTTGSLLAQAGYSQATIADILGHKRRGITDRYSHLNVEHLRPALESIVDKQVKRSDLSMVHKVSIKSG